MRTSLDEINRAYLKFYGSPDILVKVKAEPTADLIDRASSGLINNPIMVKSQIKIKEEPIEEELISIPQSKISINDRKRITAKHWYEKNKDKHKLNVKARDNDQSTTRKRYIRELNNKTLDYSK